MLINQFYSGLYLVFGAMFMLGGLVIAFLTSELPNQNCTNETFPPLGLSMIDNSKPGYILLIIGYKERGMGRLHCVCTGLCLSLVQQCSQFVGEILKRVVRSGV